MMNGLLTIPASTLGIAWALVIVLLSTAGIVTLVVRSREASRVNRMNLVRQFSGALTRRIVAESLA